MTAHWKRVHPEVKVGDRFGAVEVLAILGRGRLGRADQSFRVRCECGQTWPIYEYNLRNRKAGCTHSRARPGEGPRVPHVVRSSPVDHFAESEETEADDAEEGNERKSFEGQRRAMLLEAERFANEAHADILAGVPVLDAWTRASASLPDDFGAEDAPVTVDGKKVDFDTDLRAIFSGGPAPTDRAPDILAGGISRSSLPEGANGTPTRPAPPAPRPPAARVAAVVPAPAGAPGAAAEGLTRLTTTVVVAKGPPRMPSQHDVLAALKEPLTVREVADVTDGKVDSAGQALLALKRRGLVESDGRGMPYRRTKAGEKAAAGEALNSIDDIVKKRATAKPAAKDKPRKVAASATRGAIIFPAPPEVLDGDDLVDSLLEKRSELIERTFKKVTAIDNMIRSYES